MLAIQAFNNCNMKLVWKEKLLNRYNGHLSGKLFYYFLSTCKCHCERGSEFTDSSSMMKLASPGNEPPAYLTLFSHLLCCVRIFSDYIGLSTRPRLFSIWGSVVMLKCLIYFTFNTFNIINYIDMNLKYMGYYQRIKFRNNNYYQCLGKKL